MSIRQPPNYLPTEATEVSGARYSPTDCTDMHRLGGYGILPYPRSHQTISPQNSRNTQKQLAEKKNLCTSVKSVGGYSPPETSVNSVNSVGGLAQTNLEWVLWKEFGGLRGYGRDAIPTQPQNYLPTEFTEHTETTGGEEKSVYICEIRGRLFSARSFCVFCEFRGRTLRSLTICVHLCASVGGYSPPEASVYSVNSVGGLAQTNLEWVCGRNSEGSVGMAATKLSSHRIHGTHRNDLRRRKICVHL